MGRRKPEKGTRSDRRWKEIHRRKSVRGSAQGREMEHRIEKIGQLLIEEGLLINFERHAANTREDWDGADFTAVAMVCGERVEKSFGVTISAGAKVLEDKFRYNGTVPEQWWIPWNTKDETIKRKILRLFAQESVSSPSF